MKRLAFNGGEISPNMALRADMDTYTRSCTTLTNFDIAPTGGISRRRGMRMIDSHLPESILIPFKTTGNTAYLIVLSTASALIINPSTGTQIAALVPPFPYTDLSSITYLQINSLLLICSPSTPLAHIRLSGSTWSFTTFTFKNTPWETIDYQTQQLILTPFKSGSSTLYRAIAQDTPDPSDPSDTDDDDDDDSEYDDDPSDDLCESGELLRVSYYTDRQEASAPASQLTANLKILTDLSSSTFSVGAKIAYPSTPFYEYYICTKDWTGQNDLTDGFTSPANYKDHFSTADDTSTFNTSAAIYALTSTSSYKKGDKICLITGEWLLYTCIRPYTSTNYLAGKNTPADYPDHFTPGLPIASPLPCQGKWLFYCSGTWYGTYEIRRSYKGNTLTDEWETIKESVSPITNPENNLIEGDEEEEECYLQLLITKVKNINPKSPAAAWPLDSCANKLIIYSYHRQIILQRLAVGDFKDITPIQAPLTKQLTTLDWSLQAFRTATGYPRLACLHQQRLFLASTPAQPQTIWASRTDDLNNFATGDLDTSALLLEMQTGTQASICWMTEKGNEILIGTEDAEWVFTSRNDSALTAENAHLTRRGHHGSAHIPPILADDSVLYCARGESRIYEFIYTYEINGYSSKDLTIFADHIAASEGGITGGTVINKPHCIAIFTTRSGNLLLMTYNTLHNVNAWHRYTTQGTIEHACAIPNGNNPDKLFLLVKRGTTRYLECIDENSPYTDGENHEEYTSEMITTAFSAPDANDTKRPTSPLQIYLQTPLPAEDIMLTLGETYRPINRTGILAPGWHTLLSPAAWRYSPSIGLKLTGNSATILALQI